MSTRTNPDVAAIAHLDFRARCGVTRKNRAGTVHESCDREAAWMAPCCGNCVPFCATHATARLPFKCRGCGLFHPSPAVFTWVML